jgi:hypothetical protein
MRRRFKTMSGPMVAACALALAATAAPALAVENPPEFQANKTGATKGVGVGSNETFRLNPLTVICLRSTSTGSIEQVKSEALTKVIVKYVNCKTFTIIPVTVSPASFEFLANGTVRIEEPITLTVSALKCSVTIAAQTAATPLVLYSDITEYGKKMFPEGQLKLAMNTSLTNLSYTASNWPCAGPTKEEQPEERSGEEGKFTGEMKDELQGGDLTWVR